MPIFTYPNSPYQLHAPFEPAGDQPAAIESLLTGLANGERMQTLLGVTGSGKTYTLAQVVAQSGRPALLMAPNKTLAAQLYSEMKSYFPNNAVEYFVSYYDYYQPEAYVPSKDLFIDKDAVINEQIEQLRLSATKSLLEREDVIIIASVSAIYGMGDPQDYQGMILPLKIGGAFSQRALLMRLTELQYTRNELDFQRGCFRVRGDQVDIFPAEHADRALRVQLFDDEIENLSFFDPLSGKTLEKVRKFTIYPSSHYVTSRAVIVNALEKIKEELRERLATLIAADRLVEAQRLEQRTRFDLEMLNETGFCKGIEHYSRHLSGHVAGEPPPTLMHYLPPQTLVLIDESHVTLPQIGGMYKGDRARKENLVHYGFRLPSALDNRPLRFDEFEQLIRQAIFVSATPSEYELTHATRVVEQIVRPTNLLDPAVFVVPTQHQIDHLFTQIQDRIAVHERILVTTLTKKMAEELTDYLNEQGIKARYLHSEIDTVERVNILRDLRLGLFDVLVGINLLREGLDLPEVALVAVLDADKEGFLRSDRSLIQTIGRAARNVNGTVILYADRMTPSMKRAIDETERRRQKQLIFNQKYGIQPRNVMKKIDDLQSHLAESETVSKINPQQNLNGTLSQKELHQKIEKLQKQMKTYAKNLEFEAAAKIRDELKMLLLSVETR